MDKESKKTSPNLCSICGSRIVNPNAKRCSVCGSSLVPEDGAVKTTREAPLRGSRMPEVTINLPITVILIMILLGIGGVATYYGLDLRGRVAEPTPTVTATITPTQTITPTPLPPTVTVPPQPTPTPFTHIVQVDESCLYLAAYYDSSITAIIRENSLDANCSLVVGETIKVPQPTPTSTPLASPTPNATQLAITNCESEVVNVAEGQTLASISEEYSVPMDTIIFWNGLASDAVFEEQRIVVPICAVSPDLVNPTPTLVPTYVAPKLLLPVEGSSYTLEDNQVILQWASVGTLDEEQYYEVSLINTSTEDGETFVFYVKDTKFIVPDTFRPSGTAPEIFRWSVSPVERTGETEEGEGLYIPVGSTSYTRVFSWSGSAGQ